ncbi:hypothetical protein [Fodinicola feengrottensis]|nr:hypothetical protein [Fodinicola feengrottensis]
MGTSQLAVLAVLETAVTDGQADGSIRSGKPDALARMLLLTGQSAVLSHRLVTDRLDYDQLVDELSLLLDGYLKP